MKLARLCQPALLTSLHHLDLQIYHCTLTEVAGLSLMGPHPPTGKHPGMNIREIT